MGRSSTTPEGRRRAADAPGAETEALRAWLDEAVRLVDASAVLPGGSDGDTVGSRTGDDRPRNG